MTRKTAYLAFAFLSLIAATLAVIAATLLLGPGPVRRFAADIDFALIGFAAFCLWAAVAAFGRKGSAE